MSFNGSGTFQINSVGNPVVTGTTISSTWANALTADLATGLSTCITKDGQTTPTANIPLGSNKITGLASGTAATDAINLSQLTQFGVPGYTTTATAAGTTALTVASTYEQFFTGTTTQTVTLPVTSTLVLGFSFRIVNNSTGVVTVNSSGGNAVVAMVAASEVIVTCILTTGTTAASWDVKYRGKAGVSGTGNFVLASSPTISTLTLSGTTTLASTGTLDNTNTITQTQDAESIFSVLNSSSGTGASSSFYLQNGTATARFRLFGSSFTTSGISRQNGAMITAGGAGGLTLATGVAQPIYLAVNGTEVARLPDTTTGITVGKSSNALGTVGATIAMTTASNFTRDGGEVVSINRLTSDGTLVGCYSRTVSVGSISVTSSATAFNTSSDYRVKIITGSYSGALSKIGLLKVYLGRFKADESQREQAMMIAHEVQEIIPEVITGVKDAVDDDGNPIIQGADWSKLGPYLVAAIQELKADFDAYKAQHP